jgi:hemerythrin-like metal-binding protein
MPLIKWRESYSVGVEQFDNEHRKLVELTNKMFVIVRDKQGIMALSDSVARLIDYTQFHFASEEAAMEKANFPNLAAHKKLHAELEQEVTAFRERLQTEGEAVSTELYHFLRDWLLLHIVEEDKQYTELLTTEHRAQEEQK